MLFKPLKDKSVDWFTHNGSYVPPTGSPNTRQTYKIRVLRSLGFPTAPRLNQGVATTQGMLEVQLRPTPVSPTTLADRFRLSTWTQ